MASNNRTLAYIRESNDFGRDVQVRACKQIAELHGLNLGKGSFVVEQYITERLSLLSLVPRIEGGDVLIVSDLGVLADKPSELLSVASKLTARGARVLVANLGGELPLPVLRAFCEAFRGLEQEIIRAQADLIKQVKAHQEEIAEYTAAYEQELLKILSERGVSLGSLIGGADGSGPPRPSEGKTLRTMREALGMTQEQAGQLVEGDGLSKVMVSRLESDGRGPNLGEYRVALVAEAERRRVAAETAEAEAMG